MAALCPTTPAMTSMPRAALASETCGGAWPLMRSRSAAKFAEAICTAEFADGSTSTVAGCPRPMSAKLVFAALVQTETDPVQAKVAQAVVKKRTAATRANGFMARESYWRTNPFCQPNFTTGRAKCSLPANLASTIPVSVAGDPSRKRHPGPGEAQQQPARNREQEHPARNQVDRMNPPTVTQIVHARPDQESDGDHRRSDEARQSERHEYQAVEPSHRGDQHA